MELDSADQQITIQLQPLAGERFDTETIAACLDYTITQTKKPAKSA